MPGSTCRLIPPPSLRAWAGLALVILAVAARDASRGSDSGVAASWRVGRPVPIAVEARGGQGRATFTFPTPGSGSKVLVVVSTLSRGPGPFPVELTARRAGLGKVVAPRLEPGPKRRPALLKAVGLDPVARPAGTLPPASRTFHLMVHDGDVASASNYRAVAGTLRAVGGRVQVYVDEEGQGRAVDPAVLADLVATFDGQVFPRAAGSFGQARDVDGDGRFTVLMSPWLTRLASGRHAVDGFVRGADFDPGLAAPFSNHCDMMYLSSALEAGPHLRTVLAHEYTHAVTFSVKSFGPLGCDARVSEEGWLDEGIAHLVEDLHGFSHTNLDYRVSAFLSDPERYRLVVDDYYAADLFRSHGNRGAAYLFLRWCVDRYGPALIPTLIGSERVGIANLEGATGSTFEELYRAWSVALFLSGLDPKAEEDAAGFRSIDLRSPLGGWELAGPRWHGVAPGDKTETWRSSATSSRFFVVGASPTGATEVEVSAPEGSALQVTAVPLADDLASPALTAHIEAGPDGAPSLVATVEGRDGTPFTLTALAWEPLVPGPDPHARAFRHAGLDAKAVAAHFGSAAVPAVGRLNARPIVTLGATEPGAPLVLKAIGTDPKGRRVAAWATVSTEPAEAHDAPTWAEGTCPQLGP